MQKQTAKGYFEKVRKQMRALPLESDTLEAAIDGLAKIVHESYKNGKRDAKKTTTPNPYKQAAPDGVAEDLSDY